MSQLSRSVGSVGSVGLALTLLLSGCADLTAPGNGAPPPAPEPVAEKPAEAAPTPTPAPTPPPAPAAEERIGAAHILVQYKGAMRGAPKVTRTKDEAKKLAGEIAVKAKKPGADFAALAKQYSDEPGAADRGGSLGTFRRGQMVKPFEDAAFALKPGEISGVVETDFGFHVIKRTE